MNPILTGSCPHCHARIERVTPQASSGARCGACGGAYLAVLPEEWESADGELELELLPHGFARPGEPGKARLDPQRWLESRGLRRPLFLWMLAAGVALLALCVLGLAAAFLPEVTFAARGAAVAAFFLWFLMPLAALLAGVVVRVLLRRADGDRRVFWNSVFAVTAGVTVLLLVTFVLGMLTRRAASGWGSWTVCALAGILAGWVTVRVAGMRPYGHALAVGLVCVLGFALLWLPFGWMQMTGALSMLLFVPPLLLGAWLRVRFGSLATPT